MSPIRQLICMVSLDLLSRIVSADALNMNGCQGLVLIWNRVRRLNFLTISSRQPELGAVKPKRMSSVLQSLLPSLRASCQQEVE